MDVVNFPAIIAQHGLLSAADLNRLNDLILIGKKMGEQRNGTQYQDRAITVAEFLSLIASANCTINLQKSYTLGTTIIYTHAKYAGPGSVDIVSPGLHITRNLTGWLFNPLFDYGSGPLTPTHSEWSFDTSDLSQVKNLTYVPLHAAVIGAIGSFSAIPGTKWIMHDLSTDKYWLVLFDVWGSGGTGEFIYERTEIMDVCDGCIHFPDGSRVCSGSVPPPVGAPVYQNYVFVDTVYGNDGTAVKNDLTKAYKTLNAAQTAAVAGDMIYVLPGTYNITSTLGKNLVDWYFSPGAIVNNTASVFQGFSINYNIYGSGNFHQTGLFVAVPLFNFNNAQVNVTMNDGSSASFAYGFVIADNLSKINITFNKADCTQRDGDLVTAYNGSTVNMYGNEARFRRIAIYTETHNGQTTTVNYYVKNTIALDGIADFTQFAPTYVYTNTGKSIVTCYGNFTTEQTVDTPYVASFLAVTGGTAIAPTIHLLGDYIRSRTTNGIVSNTAGAVIYVKSRITELQGPLAAANAGATLYLDKCRMELAGVAIRKAIIANAGSSLICDSAIIIGNDPVNGSFNFVGNPSIRVYGTTFTNEPLVGAYTNLVAGTTIVVDANVI
jgi:uncharacterized protein YacL (UPF0231 family)